MSISSTKTVMLLAVSITAIIISLTALIVPIMSTSHASDQSIHTNNNQQHYTGRTREFWLFDSDIPGFNETLMGMPHDVYSMPVMTVFKGDKVIIHFFNIEKPGGDNHSFTILAKPYKINAIIHPGQNTTITFDANTTGIFTYYCIFHQPTMRGQLIVRPPPY